MIRKGILYDSNLFLYLLTFLWPNIWSILDILVCAFEKKCVLLLLDRVLHMCISQTSLLWGQVLYFLAVSSGLAVLSFIESGN